MKTRKTAYKIGSLLGWVNAFKACSKEKSLAPLFRRVINVWIGRNIVSKLWLRKRK